MSGIYVGMAVAGFGATMASWTGWRMTDVYKRQALECDWFPGIGPWIEHLQSLHAWDYLIGSVHYLGEKEEFDNPYKMDRCV